VLDVEALIVELLDDELLVSETAVELLLLVSDNAVELLDVKLAKLLKLELELVLCDEVELMNVELELDFDNCELSLLLLELEDCSAVEELNSSNGMPALPSRICHLFSALSLLIVAPF
jgi:hypothetical protein